MIDRELVLRKLDMIKHRAARLRTKLPAEVQALKDNEVVHESIKAGVGDFDAFVKAIRSFINAGAGGGEASR